MNRRRIVLLAVTAIALVAAGASLYLHSGDGELPPGIAFGNGRIEAVQVDVATPMSGRVAEVLVEEGERVEAGQHVASLDTAQLQTQHARALADVASAESGVAAAAAAVAQARAELTLAGQRLARTRTLRERGVATEEELDTRTGDVAVTRANLAAAEANHVASERRVDAAKAQGAEIAARIDDAQLHSSASGRVLYRLVEPGAVLATGGKVLSVLDLSNIYMEFFLPAPEAHPLRLGSEARVKLDIFDFAAPATVSFVSPESQFTPRQVEIREEREQLMFRVRVRIPEALVRARIDQVKTGVRGVAYVRPGPASDAPWPESLRPPPQVLELLSPSTAVR